MSFVLTFLGDTGPNRNETLWLTLRLLRLILMTPWLAFKLLPCPYTPFAGPKTPLLKTKDPLNWLTDP